MNPFLHAAPANPGASQLPGIRPLWVASAAWVIASIACATVAMANAPVGEWSADYSQLPEAPSGESSVQAQRPAPSLVSRGVVEIIRKFDAAGTLPAGYEFTVRLRDGSTRVSSEASAANWRVGDSIMLIGGANPVASTPVSL